MYLGNFENKQDVFQEFSHSYDHIDESFEDFKDIEILLAVYDNEDYEGSAFVLFQQNGKLYEVNGGHCSCYGLEGQWDPEETSVKELRHRLENGYLGRSYISGFVEELKEVLDKWGG